MKKTILFGEKDRTFRWKRPYFLRKKTVLFWEKDYTFRGKRPYFFSQSLSHYSRTDCPYRNLLLILPEIFRKHRLNLFPNDEVP